MTWPVHLGKMVKLFGKMLEDLSGKLALDPGPAAPPRELPSPLRVMDRPPVSTMLRDAMIVSISHSWNRSTTSAHVSWNRFSFSNFLKTVDLISTN